MRYIVMFGDFPPNEIIEFLNDHKVEMPVVTGSFITISDPSDDVLEHIKKIGLNIFEDFQVDLD